MPAPAGTAIRCFVGVPLPEPVRRQLEALTGRLAGLLGSRITWARPENAHVTLKFLGAVPVERVDDLRRVLRAVPLEPFDLLLGGAGCFPARKVGLGPVKGQRSGKGQGGDKGRGGAPSVLWVGLARGAAQLAALAGMVESACAGLGFAATPGVFTPHVTLGRVREPAQGDSWGEALRLIDEAAWECVRVERFVLWRSTLGPGGPKHAPLEDCSALAAATPGDTL